MISTFEFPCSKVPYSRCAFTLLYHFLSSLFLSFYLSQGVIVANGHHWLRRMPSYPGQERFAGKIMHSKDYKVPICSQSLELRLPAFSLALVSGLVFLSSFVC